MKRPEGRTGRTGRTGRRTWRPAGLNGLNGSDEGALLDPGSWEQWSGRDYLLIRDLPSSERPRERLARFGPAYLSDAELLAIIWRTGTSGNARESALDVAGRALARFGGLAGLARAARRS